MNGIKKFGLGLCILLTLVMLYSYNSQTNPFQDRTQRQYEGWLVRFEEKLKLGKEMPQASSPELKISVDFPSIERNWNLRLGRENEQLGFKKQLRLLQLLREASFFRSAKAVDKPDASSGVFIQIKDEKTVFSGYVPFKKVKKNVALKNFVELLILEVEKT